ncbi:MAG: OmpA family protein [Polyangiales bacterium]
MLSSRQTLTMCAGLLLAAGCVHDAKQTSTSTPAHAFNTNDPIPEEPQDREMRAAIRNQTRSDACALAVYFDTDSARLDEGSRDRLDTVAECMKRREIDHATIVGQTDPSGSAKYNEELGLDRARAVAEYLRGRGVPDEQIRVRSKGEMASTTQPVELWPVERRAGVQTD